MNIYAIVLMIIASGTALSAEPINLKVMPNSVENLGGEAFVYPPVVKRETEDFIPFSMNSPCHEMGSIPKDKSFAAEIGDGAVSFCRGYWEWFSPKSRSDILYFYSMQLPNNFEVDLEFKMKNYRAFEVYQKVTILVNNLGVVEVVLPDAYECKSSLVCDRIPFRISGVRKVDSSAAAAYENKNVLRRSIILVGFGDEPYSDKFMDDWTKTDSVLKYFEVYRSLERDEIFIREKAVKDKIEKEKREAEAKIERDRLNRENAAWAAAQEAKAKAAEAPPLAALPVFSNPYDCVAWSTYQQTMDSSCPGSGAWTGSRFVLQNRTDYQVEILVRRITNAGSTDQRITLMPNVPRGADGAKFDLGCRQPSLDYKIIQCRVVGK